jgi:hypothetical protein
MSETCPKCRRVQYFTCGVKTCPCWPIPKGKKHQVYKGHDILACPYCGFSAHMDYWETRDMEQALACRESLPESDTVKP